MKERLVSLVRDSKWFMQALHAVSDLRLESWCIGAGAVRNLVWDDLHAYKQPSKLADVDVTYFDNRDISPIRDQYLQSILRNKCPEFPWEVTNQAAVHIWFEGHFGHPVETLISLDDAVASWPEFATCVGIFLDNRDAIQVIAPYGLEDLFACRIRRNPKRVSSETYLQRLAEKRYVERWPNVTVYS